MLIDVPHAPNVPLNQHSGPCSTLPTPHCRRQPLRQRWEQILTYPDYVSNLLLTVLDVQLHNRSFTTRTSTIEQSVGTRSAPLATSKASLIDSPTTVMATGRPPSTCGGTGTATASAGYAASWRGPADRGWLTRVPCGLGHTAATTNATSPRRQQHRTGSLLLVGDAPGHRHGEADAWLHSFVRRVLGRDLDDIQLVMEVRGATDRMGRPARELDAGIWESERGGPGAI